MKLAYLISVWLHIVVASFWIGGSLSIALLFIPALRQPQLRETGLVLLREMATKFRSYAWLSFFLLIVTGILNLQFRFDLKTLLKTEFWHSSIGNVIGLKFLAILLILLLSAVHDFYLGPRASSAWRLDPKSRRTLKFRKQAAWIGRINLLLSLIAIGLGIILVRGWS